MATRINLIYHKAHLFISCRSQVCWHLWSRGVPLPLPESFCYHPGNYSSSGLCPTVPPRCLSRDPPASDPSLPLGSALCPGNTPVLQAGHPHCSCQLPESGDGQVCCAMVALGLHASEFLWWFSAFPELCQSCHLTRVAMLGHLFAALRGGLCVDSTTWEGALTCHGLNQLPWK